MTFWLTVGVAVLVLLALGYRYDRKHRRIGDGLSGGQMTERGMGNEGQAQEKGVRWNGMPYGDGGGGAAGGSGG